MCDPIGPSVAPSPLYDLADAFDQLPVGVAIFDVSDTFRCLRHNPPFLRMIGAGWRERGSAVGSPLYEMLSPESYAQTRAIFLRVLAEVTALL